MVATSRIPASIRFRIVFAFIWVIATITVLIALFAGARITNSILLASLIFIGSAMGGLFGVYLIAYIIRPTLQLSHEVEAVMAGTREQVSSATTSHELNAIASSFNVMKDRLQQIEQERKQANEQQELTESLLREKLRQYSLTAAIVKQPDLFLVPERLHSLIVQRAKFLFELPAAVFFKKAPGNDPNEYQLIQAAGLPIPADAPRSWIFPAEALEHLRAGAIIEETSGWIAETAIGNLFKPIHPAHIVCVPVLLDGSLRALILLAQKGELSFPENKRELLKPLAAEIAMAMNFSKAYRKYWHDYREISQTFATAWEYWHPYHRGHAAAVAKYAGAAAMGMGLPPSEREALICAAYLGNLGELGISPLIMQKMHNKQPMNPDDRKILQNHPFTSIEILNAIEMKRVIADIIINHHERWDGSGYPGGAKGDTIPVGARLLALASDYHQLQTEHPPKPGQSRDFIYEELRQKAGKEHDPALVEPFIAAMRALARSQNSGF